VVDLPNVLLMMIQVFRQGEVDLNQNLRLNELQNQANHHKHGRGH